MNPTEDLPNVANDLLDVRNANSPIRSPITDSFGIRSSERQSKRTYDSQYMYSDQVYHKGSTSETASASKKRGRPASSKGIGTSNTGSAKKRGRPAGSKGKCVQEGGNCHLNLED